MPTEPTDKSPNPPSRRDALALAMAKGLSVAASAREAGCSLQTAFRARKDPKFRERVAELRGQLIDAAVGKLSGAAGEAADQFRTLLADPDSGIRLRAAQSILDRLVTLRSHAELEARLTELEARLVDQGGGR